MTEKIKQKALWLADKIATERNFTVFIILTLVLIPLGEFATNIHGVSFESQPVIVAFAGWAGAIMTVSYFIKKRRKYYLSDIFLLTLFIFAIISYVFSHDRIATVFGFYYDEWLIHYIAYFTLMFAATNVKKLQYKKYILAAFVAVTIIDIVPSLLQSVGMWPQYSFFDPEWHETDKLTYGLTQHCNFYAGIATLFTACCTMLYLFAKKKKTRNILFVVNLLSFYCSICTNTRIAWVGNICFFLFMIIFEFIMYKKNGDKELLKSHFKRIGLTAVCFGVILFLLIGVWGRLSGEFDNTLSELNNATDLEGFDGFATGRGYIWRIGIESVPDFWATGIGLDNYRDAFEYRPDYDTLPWTQGKGHNEYIHILVTEGVFAITNYLILLFYAFFTGAKSCVRGFKKQRESSVITWIFLVMFIAYTSQACFNSSIVNTTPYFWVVLGMVMTKEHQRPLGYRKQIKNRISKPKEA